MENLSSTQSAKPPQGMPISASAFSYACASLANPALLHTEWGHTLGCSTAEPTTHAARADSTPPPTALPLSLRPTTTVLPPSHSIVDNSALRSPIEPIHQPLVPCSATHFPPSQRIRAAVTLHRPSVSSNHMVCAGRAVAFRARLVPYELAQMHDALRGPHGRDVVLAEALHKHLRATRATATATPASVWNMHLRMRGKLGDGMHTSNAWLRCWVIFSKSLPSCTNRFWSRLPAPPERARVSTHARPRANTDAVRDPDHGDARAC
eukprot:2027739-Rhodomonas_salina.1